MSKKEKRFIKVFTQGGGMSGPSYYVLVDKETGINYLYASGGYGASLTPLLDKDGKPIVTPVENEV